MDTKFENQNNEEWFQNASLVTNYDQNLNGYFVSPTVIEISNLKDIKE